MNTLRRLLIFSHIVPLLFIIPLMAFALIFILESQVILVNLSQQVLGQAALLTDFAADSPGIWQDPEEAQAFVDSLNPQITAHLMLLDSEGRLLAAADQMYSSHGQALAVSGLATALSGKHSVVTQYERHPRTEVVDVLAPATDAEGRVIGVIRLTHRHDTVQKRFQRLRSLIITILAVGSFAGIVMGFLLAITLEKSVKDLTTAIERLASGDQFVTLPKGGPTEICTLVNAINSLRERLNMSRMARRKLLANLIHEVGRPLGAIRAATWSLINGASDDPTLRKELLEGMDAQLVTLQYLLDDLARYYDRAPDALDLHRQPIALSGWLHTILTPWREIARQNSVEWSVSIPVFLPTLPIDPDRLGQAVGNLLSNAIKYTKSEGSILVSAGTTESEAWIQVSDSGSGIAPEEQPYVFEIFFRGRHGSPSCKGMGLGLAITQELVMAHGGRLELDSVTGQGSHFTIWLPLS